MEPRTLVLGLFVFCMAFIEGTGDDWLGVAVIDGYDATPAVGSLTLGDLPRRDDHGPLVRARAAGPLRARPERAHDAASACAGALLVVFARPAAARDGGRRAVGARERARVSRSA